jgi:Septin
MTLSELFFLDDDLYVHPPDNTTMIDPPKSLSMPSTSGKPPFLTQPPGLMVNKSGHDDDFVVSSTMEHALSSSIQHPDYDASLEPLESHSLIVPSTSPKMDTTTTVSSSSYCCCPMIVTHVDDTVKRYNFMVAGPSGAGKSSFCNAMFRRHFANFTRTTTTTTPLDGRPTTTLGERGRGETRLGHERILVTVVDTVGHGDEECGKATTTTTPKNAVLDYIETQYTNYDQDQMYMPHKSLADDTRIHGLFYFFAPHRVTQTDIAMLRQLHCSPNQQGRLAHSVGVGRTAGNDSRSFEKGRH